MSIDSWGVLPKSQTDNETIEGAITRLIQAHDDDPTSHLDPGQSLQSHRASEIIDHEAYSIVSDKLATYLTTSLLFRENGGTLDSWIIPAMTGASELRKLIFDYGFYAESTTGSRADGTVAFNHYYLNYGVDDAHLEFATDFGQAGTVDTWCSIGWGPIYTAQIGYGFRYKRSNGHVYAFFHNGATYDETDLGAPDGAYHTYRVDLTTTEIQWSVDGAPIKTKTSGLPTGRHDALVTCGAVPTNTHNGAIALQYLEYYQSSGIDYT